MKRIQRCMTAIHMRTHPFTTALKSCLPLCAVPGLPCASFPTSRTARLSRSYKAFFAPGTFQYVFGARDGIPQKPDPAMVNYLLKEMDISPEECIYVGDTKTDMDTGKAAGVLPWAFCGAFATGRAYAPPRRFFSGASTRYTKAYLRLLLAGTEMRQIDKSNHIL